MGSLLVLASKDLRLLWRDKFGLFWVALFPLLMALFFGSIFGSGETRSGTMKIALVDQQQTKLSGQLAEKLAGKEILKISALPFDSAQGMVRKGKLAAYVLLKGDTASESNYNPFAMPPIEIGIDPARKAEAGYLQGMVTEAWFSLMQERMTDREETSRWLDEGLASLQNDGSLPNDQRDALTRLLEGYDDYLASIDSTQSAAAASPFGETNIAVVEITAEREGPRNPYEITFPQALTWALLGTCLTFAVSIVNERRRGTFLRLRLAPISRGHILAGKGIACLATTVAVSALLLAIGVLIFGVRIVFPAGMVIALLASGICFVGLMMLISVLGKTEQAVAGAGWAIMMVMAMTGGAMVPLMFMPSWMLSLSNFSVIKWTIYALEGAIWRGFTLSQMLLPAAILVGIGLAAYGIGVAILARTDA